MNFKYFWQLCGWLDSLGDASVKYKDLADSKVGDTKRIRLVEHEMARWLDFGFFGCMMASARDNGVYAPRRASRLARRMTIK